MARRAAGPSAAATSKAPEKAAKIPAAGMSNAIAIGYARTRRQILA
jgi:hypothetical protein